MDTKTFQYALTPDDLVRLTAWRDREFFVRGHLVLMFMVLACAGISGWLAIISWDTAIGFLIILLLGWLVSRFRHGAYSQIRRSIQKMSPPARALVFAPTKIVIDDVGLRVTSALSEVFKKWEAVEKIYLAEEGIVFMFATEPYDPRLYLPSRLFAGPQEMENVHMIFQNYLNAAHLNFQTVRAALPVDSADSTPIAARVFPEYKPPMSLKRLIFDLVLLLVFLALFISASLGLFKR